MGNEWGADRATPSEGADEGNQTPLTDEQRVQIQTEVDDLVERIKAYPKTVIPATAWEPEHVRASIGNPLDGGPISDLSEDADLLWMSTTDHGNPELTHAELHHFNSQQAAMDHPYTHGHPLRTLVTIHFRPTEREIMLGTNTTYIYGIPWDGGLVRLSHSQSAPEVRLGGNDFERISKGIAFMRGHLHQ